MSTRTAGRIVGALFLLAFAVYITGTALVGSGSGLPDSPPRADDPRIPAGALLMLVNSAAVAGIGVLALPVLRPHDETSAHAYAISRAIEAVMLAVGVVFVLLLVPLAKEQADAGAEGSALFQALARTALQGNEYAYQVAMTSLAVGGLLFCRVLLRARLVPAPLAVWGLAGYAVFLAGAVLEILGHEVGLVLSVPGGLFEVALGVLLVVRGFPAVGADARRLPVT
ncbi:DUF4386 domain-containing protein [Actinocorallia populi]|uniref:DUF4386 domain-containing protein n=1 Tax=Actinocorallia populi TaxID=2079200 RepID=UPI000D096E78|nr:DUF4386 domain-containing protein [Actinocorallia populi]